MFELYADKNQLAVRRKEPIISGSVNVYRVRLAFSPDWDGLIREAVFKGSGKQVSVLLDENGECTVPQETIARHGGLLMVGICGAADGFVFPTVWANLGMILEGAADSGEPSKPPVSILNRIAIATEQEVNEMLDHVFGVNGKE